ncbi:MAG: O-antigen polymerase [Fidelibacterota bacterium]
MQLINYDKGIILALPLLILTSLLMIPDDYIFYSISILSALLCYEFVVYKYRFIFGLTGLNYLSVPSLMVLTFTIFISLPSIYIAGASVHPSRIPFFISILSFYFLFPLGLIIGQKIRPIEQVKLIDLKQAVRKMDMDKRFYELLIILLTLCLGILVLYLLRTDTIPLFELIKTPGDSTKFFYLREDALKTLQITRIERYAVHWLRSLFIPFGIIGSLVLSTLYQKRTYKILFINYLLIGLFVNTMTLEKSPLATVILVIAAYYYLKAKKVNALRIIGIIIAVLAGPMVITYFIFYGREDIFRVIYLSYFNRLIIVPSEVLSYYFQYFPEKHDFLWGRSSQLFSWMSQFGTFPISNYVAKVWWKDPFTTGNANAMYLGNFWADFGYIGPLLSTPIIGLVSHLFYRKILVTADYSMNIIYITVIAVCVPLFTFSFFSSNFTILFFTKGLVLIVIFLYWIENRK